MKTADNPAFLVVDGNNVIHAWPDLLALHRQRRGLGHNELCRRLRQYQDASDFRVVVVFDGRGGRFEEIREPGGLQIIYTGDGNTADDVIERLVARHGKRYRMTVATDDLAEQNLVASLGADICSAGLLRDMVNRESGRWREQLKRRDRFREAR